MWQTRITPTCRSLFATTLREVLTNYPGVAKLIEQSSASTNSVSVVGTTGYLAPKTAYTIIWRTQALPGKLAGIFYNTGSQGGGQETTPLTLITQLVHHGMIYVPIGYTFWGGMVEMGEVKGGSPYGVGTYAGDGSRMPSELELEQAFHQGKYIAGITKKLKGTA